MSDPRWSQLWPGVVEVVAGMQEVNNNACTQQQRAAFHLAGVNTPPIGSQPPAEAVAQNVGETQRTEAMKRNICTFPLYSVNVKRRELEPRHCGRNEACTT